MADVQQSLTDSIDVDEWAQLRTRWPTAIQRHARLEVNDPFLTGGHQTLLHDGRRAEVCYIAYEKHPDTGLLLHVKTIYPAEAYRLPTGGIQPGEAVWDTLLREIPEETGLEVGDGPDKVRVHELLGVLTYEFVHLGLAQSFDFATYHFLVEFPTGATLDPQDPSERIGGWQWRRPQELPTVANTLAGLGASSPDWADWGRFRALSHHFVSQALK
jgi:8-oxo-dGTP pyrophosphatase MutT (NUDIX family)